jgi:hypothetical protein
LTFQLAEQAFFDIDRHFAVAGQRAAKGRAAALRSNPAAGQDVQVVVEVIAPPTMPQMPARRGCWQARKIDARRIAHQTSKRQLA